MKRLQNLKVIERILNRLKLREKILGLFIFCVIIPLILIDGIIIERIVSEERAEERNDSMSMAESVNTYFDDVIKNCQNVATSVNQNYKIGEVLGTKYESVYDYYEQYHKMTENHFYQTLVHFGNMKVKLYTSNDTVMGGGYVGKIDAIENTDWYRYFKKSSGPYVFMCDYDVSGSTTESKRKLFYLQRLGFNNDCENFIRIDVDYSTVSRALESMGHSNSIYVCQDDTILFSNKGYNSNGVPFETETNFKNIAYDMKCSNIGKIDRIVVLKEKRSALDYLYKNRLIMIIVFFGSIILPIFVIYQIDYSIVHRIEKLNNVFGKRVNDELILVDNPEGSDELGHLMHSYNRMVVEVNNLIQIVYKNRLKEQESDIARQNAELLALHSQINPHFMFNALESIRMHSIIKGENETAEMVEKLAIMERQYVDWGSDMLQISQELNSVEAYLVLQKYRFGDKLMYEINVDDDCASQLIPKLTVVTFVENACVHGMENKTSKCYVFVRVYKDADRVVIEIEDTGNGMSEDKVKEFSIKAKTIELNDLKNVGHVGIFNALLRLKMTMGENYEFEIESEEGIGTMIQIKIPIKEVSNNAEGIIS